MTILEGSEVWPNRHDLTILWILGSRRVAEFPNYVSQNFYAAPLVRYQSHESTA